jgi:hypothetical protein
MKMTAITATTPPMMMPNVPLLSLFMTSVQRSPRESVPKTTCAENSQKSLLKSGHFEEYGYAIGKAAVRKRAEGVALAIQ